MALSLVTLTGTYEDGEGRPLRGYLQFVPSAPLTDTTAPEEVRQEPVLVLVRQDGTFSVPLYATDSTDLAPAGWSWQVTEHVTGLPVSSWSFFLAFANGSTQDISALAPVSPVTAMTGYLPVTGGTITGPLTLPGNPTGALQAVPKQYVDAETARAEAAEAASTAAIAAETTRAETAEAAAQGNAEAFATSAVAAETNRAETAEASSASAVTTEMDRAEAAEAARLVAANNLSDLESASAAVTNLGLGTAATQDTAAFDAAGSASAAQSAAEDFATSAVTAETSRATAAEGTNASAISAETSRATTAEGANTAAVTAETARAEGAEASIPTTGTPLAVNRGGTGSGTQNFTDLTSNQTITGVKTFTGEVIVPAPVNSTDAATKAYVDAVAQGLSVKKSVVAATAAALPAYTYSNGTSGVGATLTGNSTGTLTVDTHTVVLNDRILVKNETGSPGAAYNGIYVCTVEGAGGGSPAAYVLTRSTDMDQGTEVPGAFTFVQSGSVNALCGFVVMSTGTYLIGTTPILWTQFSAAGSVSAGAGLSQDGSVIAIENSGVLTVAHGGTGAGSAGAALTSLGAAGTASNLSDLTSASTARTNLGLGTAATLASSAVAQTASNLSDLTSATVARANLGLGSAATQGTSAFDAAGAGTAATSAMLAAQNTFTADQYFKSGRPWYDVVAFGADPTGGSDSTAAINAAITAAASAGGTVFVPAGTYVISGGGIIIKGTNVEICGTGPASIIQPSGVMGFMFANGSATGSNFTISGLCLDGLFQATNIIILGGTTMQGLTCTNVTIRNPGFGQAVHLVGCSDVTFDHCTFTGNSQAGEPSGTMVEMFNGARRIRLSYCTFESYVNGIIGNSGSHPYDAMIDDVEIDHCYFNGSWWLIPAGTSAQVGTPSGSGGTVTYTATALTDTAAAFAGIPQFNNVRVMPTRWTGTITTSQQLALIDSAATFNATSAYGIVTRGDIVRTSAAWAMVEGAESSGTTLRISQWRSLTTWQVVAAPAVTTAYTVYATIIGRITAAITGPATTLPAVWLTYLGAPVTPPAGTYYEVLCPRPNYAVNFNPGTWNVRVTNCEFFANWSDQCSNYGSECQIIGNYIHDGQDGGITINAGDRHIVAGNRIRHQGSVGIFFYGSDSAVTGNTFGGGGWTNPQSTASGLGSEVIGWCQNTTFTGNTFISDSGISGMTGQNFGLTLYGGSAGNYVSADNIFGGHAVADIWLDGTAGLGPNEIHAQSGTVIGYNGATPGQLLFYSGTGPPVLPAAVGSTYIQTDDITGAPNWVYTSSGWSQGATGGGSGGGSAIIPPTTPTGLAVTPAGTTGSTTYAYRVAAAAGTVVTPPCAEVQITTGNATLSSGNYNALTWTAVVDAGGYKVYGRAAGSESLLATVATNSYNDTGSATPAADRNLFNLYSGSITPSFYGSTVGWNAGTGTTKSADATTGPNVNNCSMKLVTAGINDPINTLTNTLPAVPGATYTMSFYAKGSGNLYIYLNSTPAFAGISGGGGTVTLTPTWTRHSFTCVCPAGQTNLFVSATMNIATTYWLSCFQIENAASASAYIDTTAAVAMPASGSELIIQANTGQTGDLLEVENASGNSLFSVDTNGNVTTGLSMTTPVVIQPRATQSLATAGAVTISAAAGDAVISLSATASSSSITNPVPDQILRITWLQDSTGGRTYAWPANCYFAGSSAPSDTTASKRTTVTFRYDSSLSNWYELDRAVAVG